jgi:hypothetical protein
VVLAVSGVYPVVGALGAGPWVDFLASEDLGQAEVAASVVQLLVAGVVVLGRLVLARAVVAVALDML